MNRDSLRPWLEDLKKIADNCGILPSRKEGRAANIWDLGSDVKLVLQETDGFNQAMTPYAVAELLNANVVSVENAFYPKMVIGINSRSEHVEIAKDFLRFALSEELQRVDTYEGFPCQCKSVGDAGCSRPQHGGSLYHPMISTAVPQSSPSKPTLRRPRTI